MSEASSESTSGDESANINSFALLSLEGDGGSIDQARTSRAPAVESDERRLATRQRDIDKTKNMDPYKHYADICGSLRPPDFPQTPDRTQICSKRSWDGQITKWKRSLHSLSGAKSVDDMRSILAKQRQEVHKPREAVALDCEFVGVDSGGQRDALARVAIVNVNEDVLLDIYVRPDEPIVDYRTPVSGIREEDLIDAIEFAEAQKAVKGILQDRIIVGHNLRSDFSVLGLRFPPYVIRDTAKYPPLLKPNGKPYSLRRLCQDHLGQVIQSGEHSPVEDALATLRVYKMFMNEWESRFHNDKNLQKNRSSGKKRH